VPGRSNRHDNARLPLCKAAKHTSRKRQRIRSFDLHSKLHTSLPHRPIQRGFRAAAAQRRHGDPHRAPASPLHRPRPWWPLVTLLLLMMLVLVLVLLAIPRRCSHQSLDDGAMSPWRRRRPIAAPPCQVPCRRPPSAIQPAPSPDLQHLRLRAIAVIPRARVLLGGFIAQRLTSQRSEPGSKG